MVGRAADRCRNMKGRTTSSVLTISFGKITESRLGVVFPMTLWRASSQSVEVFDADTGRNTVFIGDLNEHSEF